MRNRVIVYDDDKDILEVCSIILNMRGYDVLCKENCKEVLADISNYDPHVILMDNWLPDVGGVKAVQLIKSIPKYKKIPVIFFSANSHVEELAKEAGADFLLKKPFDIKGLEQVLKSAMASRTPA